MKDNKNLTKVTSDKKSNDATNESKLSITPLTEKHEIADLEFNYEDGVLAVRHLKTTKLLKFTRIDTVNEGEDSNYRVSRYRISGK